MPAKTVLSKALCLILPLAFVLSSKAKADPGNPNIDMEGYLKVASIAAAHRQTRRLSEDEFIRRSQQKDTVILDARSRAMFDLLHIKGAINLSYPDIDIESLKKTLPNKNAQILIYCNNNFSGEPIAFATKLPSVSLNLSTYITLYNYGYRNIYELSPLIDVHKTKLTLVSTASPATSK
jgi:phage shock protein E